jgi:hypothetical protein
MDHKTGFSGRIPFFDFLQHIIQSLTFKLV